MHTLLSMAGTPLARTIFHGPKPVRAIEVLLYILMEVAKMEALPMYGKKHLKNLQNQKANNIGTWYVLLVMWGPTKLLN